MKILNTMDLILNMSNLPEWLSAIGTCAIPIIVWYLSDKENKNNEQLIKIEEEKKEELLSIERKAKLYSYVEIDNNKIVSLDITEHKNINEIIKVKDIFNTLKYNNIEIEKENAITMHFSLKYLTNILPNEILVDHVDIFFFKQNKCCKKIEFENPIKDFKFLYVNSESSTLTFHCIINEELLLFIKNLNLYDKMSIYVKTSFKNIFNMITSGTYFLQLKPDNTYFENNTTYDRYFYTIDYNCFDIIDIKEKMK
jgi:hypothetical protein